MRWTAKSISLWRDALYAVLFAKHFVSRTKGSPRTLCGQSKPFIYYDAMVLLFVLGLGSSRPHVVDMRCLVAPTIWCDKLHWLSLKCSSVQLNAAYPLIYCVQCLGVQYVWIRNARRIRECIYFHSSPMPVYALCSWNRYFALLFFRFIRFFGSNAPLKKLPAVCECMP